MRGSQELQFAAFVGRTSCGHENLGWVRFDCATALQAVAGSLGRCNGLRLGVLVSLESVQSFLYFLGSWWSVTAESNGLTQGRAQLASRIARADLKNCSSQP